MDISTQNINANFKRNGSNSIFPNYCCFVITLKCIMKCKMCHIWRDSGNILNELTIQEWKDVVNSLKGFLDTKYDIILSGGEPLLKKDILGLVSYIAKSGYRASLETNSYLVDEELARAIQDSGLWRICISLDSLAEDTHDSLRGRKGSYGRVMRGIEYLNKFCPSVGINIQTTIMEQNLDELAKLAEWVASDERLDYVYFQAIVRPFGTPMDENWFKGDHYGFLWPSHTDKVNLAIEELIRIKENNPKIANTVAQFKAYKAYFKDPVNFGNNIKCTIGNRDININPCGDAYLCFSKDSIGNIKNRSIEEIWYSEKADKVRNEIIGCKKHCHFLLNCSFEKGDYF
ncbi:MAG: radical SAM protein [Candidatus Omnitrophota bacterium]|nr:radical SAM protein [Candidatus Omnitrophota bacterium]